ncbi:MAG: HAD family hydrolase [Firmicutes bacterium]|nr:HAD family hydrolase [Bacillota bacterium]
MRKPKLILFDYGQTLINELYYDGVKGYSELLKYALSNPDNITGGQIQRDVEQLNSDLGRFDPATRHKCLQELPEFEINQYIFAKRGIEFDRDLREYETIFWDAAAPAEPCRGIAEFLEYLREEGIRTGVISNLSFCSETLRRRLEKYIPNAQFDFVIASSDYVFRKPSPHIFEVALAKAGIKPEDAWFCGDQFKADIDGAIAAGLTPVWYKEYLRYDSECELTDGFEINSWSELREILDKTEK